jgi:hypothetical protein
MNWWDEIKPFHPMKAVAWIEATRRSYNKNNPYGENLTFAETVEMLEESACNVDQDYRALKTIRFLREQATEEYLNGLSACANENTVAKIQRSFG